VVVGPGAPYELESERLVSFIKTKYSLLFPPEGGWVPGVRYELSSTPPDYVTHTPDADDLLIFEATGAAAGPAPEFELVEVVAEEWTPDTYYGGASCCADVRYLQLSVRLPEDSDPWAWVEARAVGGDRDWILARDVGIGPGTHVLRVEQYVEDDRQNVPPCVALVPRSAAGTEGEPVEVCRRDNLQAAAAEPLLPTTPEDTGGPPPAPSSDGCGGCAVAPGSPAGVAWLGLILVGAARVRRAR